MALTFGLPLSTGNQAGSMKYICTLCIWVNGSLETDYMFSPIWAKGLGVIRCKSMEAYDLPSPVMVAGIVEYCHYWIEMDDFAPDSSC